MYGGNGYGGVLNDLHSLRVADAENLRKETPTLTWTRITYDVPEAAPGPRIRMALFPFQDRLVLFGGYEYKDGKRSPLKDLWVIQPNPQKPNTVSSTQLKDKALESLPDLRFRSHAVACSATTISLYVAGGSTEDDEPNKEVQRLELTFPVWWLLHFLEATGMIKCLSYNEC